MIYLDYAKAVAGGYILNFFADTEEDIAEVSNGKHFITKNGIDYGVPQPSSTIVITMPDKTKKTYVLNGDGEWKEGGVEMDYSKLTNVPITLANLADEDFIPEANTYYEHLGETTEDFIKGIIYLYDGKEYKAIDGSGSGAGVQADYNQNDSTAADYIKNRPFYSDVTTENLFNQTFSTASVSGANIWATQDSVIQLTEGETVKVEFGGAEYTQEVKSLNGVLYIGNIALVGMEPNTGESFAVANIYFPAGLSNIVAGTSIATAVAQTNATIKVYKSEDIIKTIDHKYIKDMYYSTEAFTPFIDFKVISGDINAIGSTMVVQYGGKEYTETVKDAAEQGSSTHKPYIGFEMGDAPSPTEEQPFCYGVDLLFEGNTKQLFCAAPKTVSENETIIYNGENKTVKKMTVEGLSFLYVGNIHLISEDFEDTGEQYLTLFDYLSVATQGKIDLVASIVPQQGISCEVKGENISYINPKYIKDMYYTKPESDVQKILVFKGEIALSTQEAPSLFEVGDIVSLKEEAVGLDVIDEAKSAEVNNGTVAYIGNLSLLAEILQITGAVDTKEDYCALCGHSGDGSPAFIYYNKNKEMPNNIEVYKSADPIVRIPEKYLPLDVAKKSYVDTAISNAITKTLNTEV